MKVFSYRGLAVAATAAAMVSLAGCGTTGTLSATGAPVETRSTATPQPGAAAPAAASNATPQSRVATVDLARQAGGPGGSAGTQAAVGGPALRAATSQRVVYFDFDSFAIRSEYDALLEAHARMLALASGRHMVVEGHTDERGGREYNLALGQKRAEAVVKALALLGVPAARLEATSLGEERPAVQGNDEAAWAKNRRAELKDR
ncbi:MAG: peptidoglycan-associated lipoprotein Pal [Rubrivivax sp.]|nr:peptidoglycan-associated lipoprotein Pal [Rubrivivax sp.]